MGVIRAAARRPGQAVRWCASCIERHPVTAIVLVMVLGFGCMALIVRKVADDAVNRSLTEQNARIAQIEKVQALIEAETRARTTESCLTTQRSRNGTIELWDKVLAFIAPKNADGTPKPSAAIEGLREIVATSYPPVDCPQDQGPIVIPQPSTTTGAP